MKTIKSPWLFKSTYNKWFSCFGRCHPWFCIEGVAEYFDIGEAREIRVVLTSKKPRSGYSVTVELTPLRTRVNGRYPTLYGNAEDWLDETMINQMNTRKAYAYLEVK